MSDNGKIRNGQKSSSTENTINTIINKENNGNASAVDFPLIVIGASAGGLEAIKKLVAALPKELGAAVLIVWHMSADVRGMLPYILNKQQSLFAAQAYDGEPIKANRIYVAPPDHHLLVEGNNVRISRGPKENRFRPAIDPLFRSAAFYHKSRVIGVILSGALDDGTAGLWAVKEAGGIAIVQSSYDAEVPSMPDNAARYVNVDYSLPIAGMATVLVKLVKEKAVLSTSRAMKNDEKAGLEIQIAADQNDDTTAVFTLGNLTPFTCPECHGVLTAITEGNIKRFRCHTGHAYSVESLLSAMSEYIEETLWTAIRGIKETTMLMNSIGDHFAGHNDAKLAAIYFKKANEAEQQAKAIRDLVINHEEINASFDTAGIIHENRSS